MYRCNNKIYKGIRWLICKFYNVKSMKWLCYKFCKSKASQDHVRELEIPDVTYNYREFQESLLAFEPNN